MVCLMFCNLRYIYNQSRNIQLMITISPRSYNHFSSFLIDCIILFFYVVFILNLFIETVLGYTKSLRFLQKKVSLTYIEEEKKPNN